MGLILRVICMKRAIYSFFLLALGYGLGALMHGEKLRKLSAYNKELVMKLKYLQNKYCFSFQDFKAVAVPVSSIVYEGDKYQAELFMAAVPEGFIPKEILLHGQPVPINSEGHGKIEFTIPKQQDGGGSAVQKTWTGSINFSSNGRDTSLTVVVPYTIMPHHRSGPHRRPAGADGGPLL